MPRGFATASRAGCPRGDGAAGEVPRGAPVPGPEVSVPRALLLTCGIAGRRGPADVGEQVLDVGHGLSLLFLHGGLRGEGTWRSGGCRQHPGSQPGLCAPTAPQRDPPGGTGLTFSPLSSLSLKNQSDCGGRWERG